MPPSRQRFLWFCSRESSKKEKTLDQSNLCKCGERKKKSCLALLGLNVWGSGAPAAETLAAKRSWGQKGRERGFLAGTFSPPPPPPTDAFNLHIFTVLTSASAWLQQAWHNSEGLRLSARIYSHGAVTSIFQGISQARGRLGDVPAEGTTGGTHKTWCYHSVLLPAIMFEIAASPDALMFANREASFQKRFFPESQHWEEMCLSVQNQ